jgi:putative membrane protein
MKTKILCTAALALVMAACSKPTDEANNAAAADNAAVDNMAADANATAVAAPASDEFANKVAASDRFEVESGKLAADMATSDAVKSFARMLVTDHTKSTADLKAAAASTNPPVMPNDVLDMDKDAMLRKLKTAVGTDFDNQFVDQQITAHSKALELLKAYAAGGDNAALKTFATKAVPIVQGHLDKAKALKK